VEQLVLAPTALSPDYINAFVGVMWEKAVGAKMTKCTPVTGTTTAKDGKKDSKTGKSGKSGKTH